MANNKVKVQAIIEGVRFSYEHVFEVSGMEGSTPKYSVCVLIDKNDKKAVDAYNAALNNAVTQFAAAKFNGNVRAVKNFPALRDGDNEYNSEGLPKFEGYYFFNASSIKQPRVVDKYKMPISKESGEFYSGCYGNIIITFYEYAFTAKQGIAVGFEAVQKTRDSDKFGAAKLDFGAVEFNDDGGDVPF